VAVARLEAAVSRAKPIVEREALDFYATPQPLADAICRHLCRENFSCVVEPSAGHGPFVRAARAMWPEAEIVAVDVSPDRLPELSAAGADVVLVSPWQEIAALPGVGRTLIIGNPPFREAEEHIRHALDIMRPGDALAFLLRFNLLGSRGRVALWESTPLAEVAPLVPRPSFTGGSTDATEYALFRWAKGHRGPTRLSLPLVWQKSRASASVSQGER
jgi:hypothetical protein